MSPEKIRSSGVVALVVGTGLAAVVTPAWLVLLPDESSSILFLVIGLVLCFCVAAAGALSLWITDAASAVRLRRWFVVLEGVPLTLVYPVLWAILGVLIRTDSTAVSVRATAFVLLVVLPMLFFGGLSRDVHLFIAGSHGPVVPGDGAGAPAQRIRSLGTLLVVLGATMAVGVLPLQPAGAVAVPIAVFLGSCAAAVGVVLVVLGTKLRRVTDVHSARLIKPQVFFGVAGSLTVFASGPAFGTLGPVTAGGVVTGVILFGAMVLVVIAALTLRGYTGEWNWTQGRRKNRRQVSR